MGNSTDNQGNPRSFFHRSGKNGRNNLGDRVSGTQACVLTYGKATVHIRRNCIQNDLARDHV